MKIALDHRAAELEHLFQKPDSQEKIQEIATGILRKNFKFVLKFEDVESRLKQIAQRSKHTKKQIYAK